MSPEDSQCDPQTKTNIWEGLVGGFFFLEVLVLGLNPGSLEPGRLTPYPRTGALGTCILGSARNKNKLP